MDLLRAIEHVELSSLYYPVCLCTQARSDQPVPNRRGREARACGSHPGAAGRVAQTTGRRYWRGSGRGRLRITSSPPLLEDSTVEIGMPALPYHKCAIHVHYQGSPSYVSQVLVHKQAFLILNNVQHFQVIL